MGRARYPHAAELLITAEGGGGSNSSRCRLWKVALQEVADATGLTLHVSHFPPGTSKWNKIEHRLFCHVTQNWRGKPLVSHDLIVKLIGSTTTGTGLKVRAALDTDRYDDAGLQLTKPAKVNLKPAASRAVKLSVLIPADLASGVSYFLIVTPSVQPPAEGSRTVKESITSALALPVTL